MTKKKESREFPTECLLRCDPKNPVCEESQCWRCGWNEQENWNRRMLLAVQGLTLCSDGLRRLVLPERYPDRRSDTE